MQASAPHKHTARAQIILIICHLRIRSASPHCHLQHQPAAAAEYTGKQQRCGSNVN